MPDEKHPLCCNPLRQSGFSLQQRVSGIHVGIRIFVSKMCLCMLLPAKAAMLSTSLPSMIVGATARSASVSGETRRQPSSRAWTKTGRSPARADLPDRRPRTAPPPPCCRGRKSAGTVASIRLRSPVPSAWSIPESIRLSLARFADEKTRRVLAGCVTRFIRRASGRHGRRPAPCGASRPAAAESRPRRPGRTG